MSGTGDGFAELRRWTVVVLLALLVFVTVAEVFDGYFLGDRFHTDPAFYTVFGGMVAGLFVAEAAAIVRRRNS